MKVARKRTEIDQQKRAKDDRPNVPAPRRISVRIVHGNLDYLLISDYIRKRQKIKEKRILGMILQSKLKSYR